MLIDWFTVAAQALNFLVLMGLMKRFLYKPVLHAIDEREKQVTAKLADAEAKQAEARRERDAFQKKSEDLELQRATLLSQATDEARVERQRLIDEAQQEVEASGVRQQKAMRNDAEELGQMVRRRVQQEVFAIARSALGELATASLEERAVEVFTRRLREMKGPAKADLGEALKAASAPAIVRSAFELPAPQRGALQRALNEAFSVQVQLRFETAPSMIGGVELSANGQKLSWSIDDHLTSLEKSVVEALNKPPSPEHGHGARSSPPPGREAGERRA